MLLVGKSSPVAKKIFQGDLLVAVAARVDPRVRDGPGRAGARRSAIARQDLRALRQLRVPRRDDLQGGGPQAG